MHEPYLHYVSDMVDSYTNFDPDYWSFFKVVNVVEKLGYYYYLKLWGRDPTKEVGGFWVLESDKDVMELVSLPSDEMIFEIYIEHEWEDEAILLDNDNEMLPYMSGSSSSEFEFEDGDDMISNINVDESVESVEGTSRSFEIIRKMKILRMMMEVTLALVSLSRWKILLIQKVME